jgi:hypothetical protein
VSYAALADYRSKEVREALRTGLAQPDEDVLNTISIIRGQTRPMAGLPKPTAFWMLIPEVADLLSDQVPSTEVREAVNQALAHFDALDRSVRLTALNEAAASATGQRAEWIRKKIAEVEAQPAFVVAPPSNPASAPAGIPAPPIAGSGTLFFEPSTTPGAIPPAAAPASAPGQIANQFPPSSAAPPATTNASLRYEGKSFSEWAEQLRTELSPEARIKAIDALAELGSRGKGKEAAKLIFENVRENPVGPLGVHEKDPVAKLHRQRQGVTGAALSALWRVPANDLMPECAEAMRSDDTSMRLFAIQALPLDVAQTETVPLLVTAIGDKDRAVRIMARETLARIDHDNQGLVNWLRQALAGSDKADTIEALTMVGGMSQSANRGVNHIIPPYMNLLPDALNLMNHSDKKFDEHARRSLRNMTVDHLDEFEAIVSGGGPIGENARQILLESQPLHSPDRRK